MQAIYDKERILEVMRGFIQKPRAQPDEFLYLIQVKPGANWNGWTVTPGGLQVIAARPRSLVSEPKTGSYLIDLTNSDSDYTSSIGRVQLSDIEYISTLH